MEKFKPGDIVFHKISLERGVVVDVKESCVNPEHAGPVGCLVKVVNDGGSIRRKDDCQMEPYSVRVSYGFDKKADVDPLCLEISKET